MMNDLQGVVGATLRRRLLGTAEARAEGLFTSKYIGRTGVGLKMSRFLRDIIDLLPRAVRGALWRPQWGEELTPATPRTEVAVPQTRTA